MCFVATAKSTAVYLWKIVSSVAELEIRLHCIRSELFTDIDITLVPYFQEFWI